MKSRLHFGDVLILILRSWRWIVVGVMLTGVLLALAQVAVDTRRHPPEPDFAAPCPPSVTMPAEAEAADECGRALRLLPGAGLERVGTVDVLELGTTIRVAADPALGGDPACADRILRRVIESSSCGEKELAAANALMASGTTGAQGAIRLIGESSERCRAKFIGSVQWSKAVSEHLIDALLEHTGCSEDDEIFEAAWLALGTLGREARSMTDSRVATRVDDAVLGGLSRYQAAPQLVPVIGSAGNSACERCLGRLRSMAADRRTEVRAAVVAAMRFLEDDDAIRVMCKTLLGDPESPVRQRAAWALRWSRSAENERLDCLVASAATDKDARVGVEAVRSLGLLARDTPTARDGLAYLAASAGLEDVRINAASQLDGSEPP